MNIDGWEYDFSSLPYWKNREQIPWTYDFLIENKQEDNACLIYSVAEVGMGRYSGFMALLRNKVCPELVLNITRFNFCGYKDSYQYNSKGKILFTVPSMYDRDNNMLEYPILVIDITEDKFAFIHMVNGIHYKVEELDEFNYSLIDAYHDERFVTRDGEIFDTRLLKWFNLSEIDNLVGMYFK